MENMRQPRSVQLAVFPFPIVFTNQSLGRFLLGNGSSISQESKTNFIYSRSNRMETDIVNSPSSSSSSSPKEWRRVVSPTRAITSDHTSPITILLYRQRTPRGEEEGREGKRGTWSWQLEELDEGGSGWRDDLHDIRTYRAAWIDRRDKEEERERKVREYPGRHRSRRC